MLWVLLAISAATLQATRNAFSRQLVGQVSPALTAWSRFAFNLPFSAALALWLAARHGAPALPGPFWAWAFAGAATQLVANFALVAAFRVASFSQSVALHKLEVVFGAFTGLAFFGEVPSAFGWAGIVVSTAGVLLMNLARPDEQGRGWRRMFVLDRGSIYALTCGALFAFTAFFFKEAIEILSAANPRLAGGRFEPAVHTVFHVAWMQVALATPAVAWMRPGELRRTITLWPTMLGIGVTGFLGSLCWFWAFGIALVAYVRAVGQLEAPISIAISVLVFRERGVARQLPAIAAIVAGVVLVLLG
jgi:drug/metabolite transporter (DMT)-like permease